MTEENLDKFVEKKQDLEKPEKKEELKDELDKFFEGFLDKESLFTDKSVLQVKYLPDIILHRTEQMKHLASILAPVLKNDKPSNLFIYGKTGCLVGSTRVYTKTGYRFIKDIKSKEEILSFNISTRKYEWEKCNFLKFKNKDKLLQISLDNGLSITITKDHPLLLENLEWKKADELKKGEGISIAYNFTNRNTAKIPLSLARLLGFIISDGSIGQRFKRVKDSKGYWFNSNRERLRFFNSEDYLLNLVKADIEELCSYKATVYKPKNRVSYVYTISQKLCEFLNALGVPKGKKSKIVRIPPIIFNCDSKIQKEFLKALFSGDGFVSKNTNMIEYYSNSKALLQDISLLLHQYGIKNKIRYKPAKLKGKSFDSYRLYIMSYSNLLKFYKEIGFYHLEKQNRLKQMLNNYKKIREEENSNLLFSEIADIKECYEGYVYDLNMPKNHNFIANGIISHNTGKTLCMKHTIAKMDSIAKERSIPLRIIYLNCKMKKVADTEYRIIAQLAREIGEEVPMTGLPTEEVYNIFLNKLDAKKQSIIIVLDEIDQVVKKTGDEILYTLTRINSELKNSQVAFVGVSNDVRFMEDVDPRVRSSLGEEELIFPPYNALELKDILEKRSLSAFKQGVIAEGVLAKCAAYAAREHGDARRALDLLRVSGEVAERDDRQMIEPRHIDMAEEKIEKSRVLEIIETQPKQSQIVMYSILLVLEEKQKGEIAETGEVFEHYKEICKQTGNNILTQRRISDLISELDMLGLINARLISKGRYGRTREIYITIPQDMLDKIKSTLERELF